MFSAPAIGYIYTRRAHHVGPGPGAPLGPCQWSPFLPSLAHHNAASSWSHAPPPSFPAPALLRYTSALYRLTSCKLAIAFMASFNFSCVVLPFRSSSIFCRRSLLSLSAFLPRSSSRAGTVLPCVHETPTRARWVRARDAHACAESLRTPEAPTHGWCAAAAAAGAGANWGRAHLEE
eukprot:Tamp_27938.p1 GENE.Tamp_27938~~Tamp_27938.p1  ORF type:complete len:177 (+),score=3.75 Tamp_27938:224-754(+)